MTTSNAASNTATPKYSITGNTVDEIVLGLAELIVKTETLEVVDAKKGGTQYAKWEAGGGEGIVLSGKQLSTKAGIPLYLGCTVVLRKLTAPERYDAEKAAVVVKRAATIDRLKDQLARLQAK